MAKLTQEELLQQALHNFLEVRDLIETRLQSKNEIRLAAYRQRLEALVDKLVATQDPEQQEKIIREIYDLDREGFPELTNIMRQLRKMSDLFPGLVEVSRSGDSDPLEPFANLVEQMAEAYLYKGEGTQEMTLGVPPPQEERRVHAQIRFQRRERKTFVGGGEHTIRLWIGLPEDRGAVADQAIPEVEIPEEGLPLTVEMSWRDQFSKGELLLPANKTARTGDCDLTLNVPADARYVEAQILFRYQGAVFEAVQLSADVLQLDEDETRARYPLEVKVLFSQREVIALQNRRPVDTAIIVGAAPGGRGDRGDRADWIQAYGKKAYQIQMEYKNRLLAALSEHLFISEKTLVRRQAQREHAGKEQLDIQDKEVRKIMRILARHGAALYNNLPDRLKKEIGERIQVINLKTGEYFPLEFVYDKGYPVDDAVLCQDGFAALADGADQCPSCRPAADIRGSDRDQAPTICPYGFWSMQKIIERDTCDSHAFHPQAERAMLPPLQNILLASNDRVPEEERQKTWAALGEIFTQPQQAANWNEWRQMIAQTDGGQSLLLLLPHHLVRDAEDCLEIGGEELPEGDRLLARGQMRKTIVNPQALEPGPIVILLGCQTAAETGTGYIDLAHQFQKLPVSIVLGTLAKVLGRHAAPVARELVRELAAVEDGETDFGTILRRTRRKMLSRGYLMAFCVVALGDAEWRLSPRP